MRENPICVRLAALREKMLEYGIDIYIVPSSDCHESEYVSAHFRAREYITGFTGSAGTAVITMEEAGLWTDGRYFLQAEGQLKRSGIRLYRMGEPDVPTVREYVESQLGQGKCIGFDGRVMGASKALEFEQAARAQGASLLALEDLVGMIWTDRPDIPDAEIFVLEECYSGEPADNKIARVRCAMEEQRADVHVLASLCDISWLLNLRGGDIPCVPVVLSFLVMTLRTCVWYVRPSIVTDEIRNYLSKHGVEIRGYDEIYSDLKTLPAGTRVLVDRKNVNYRLLKSLPVSTVVIDQSNPTEIMKAVKNETEIKNIREAHRKESIAFTRFLYRLKTGKANLTELSAAEYLDACRAEQEHCLGQSFTPICAYGAHGAIVHYSATAETDAPILQENFLLVDAGGHYLEGTTDTTRTIAMGSLSLKQKRMYTAVLRANLRLAYAKFLKGATGYSLDALCREPLWQLGVDFKHGTGHGVGYLLNVHEGPNAFRLRIPKGEEPAELQPGMVTTDEPGVYIAGDYGIRLENELLCVEGPSNEYGQFLEFEILTLIPFDRAAILPEEMDSEELRWLNAYHQRVYETVGPYLPEEEREWLKACTARLQLGKSE
ncbi:MAG: aminopeptidase P family protein [Lachnospiraceae bacterium]|nr:aminopeptidase P family protein [Lachnospiraceae bacterium]